MNTSTYQGRWLLLIFYPHDFSFVCPTELTEFSANHREFDRRNCSLLAVSVDSIELHREWLQTPPADGGLGPMQFPLASDPDGTVAKAFGVWDAPRNVSLRGLFAIDPDGVLQYSTVHNLSVGRNVQEILRIVDALQSGGLCPVSWTRADGTIDVESALAPGRMLGNYRIVEPLGDGGFGTVFAAWDTRLERPVAIKILRAQTPDWQEKLLSEARAAARINHPNICTVHAVDEIDGLPLIVMERLSGQPLDQCFSNERRMIRTLNVFTGIAQGLDAAHQADLVHGDLKPANVIVTDDDTAKLLDFGLAKTGGEQSVAPPTSSPNPRVPLEHEFQADTTIDASDPGHESLDATQVMPPLPAPAVDATEWLGGQISGTPAYMSPEQARGEPLSTTSDIFSFGLMLHDVIAGRKAIQQTSLPQIIDLLNDPAFASNVTSELPESVSKLVERCLAANPSDRPSARDIIRELRSTLD